MHLVPQLLCLVTWFLQLPLTECPLIASLVVKGFCVPSPTGLKQSESESLASYHPEGTLYRQQKHTLSLPVREAYVLVLKLRLEGQASALAQI